MKKEYEFTVTEPLYNNEYTKYFKYKNLGKGKSRLNQ